MTPLREYVEKTAATRHLVGAGVGAGAGLLHALHRDQRVKEQDKLLEDLGQMPHDIADTRKTQRRGAALRDTVVGGLAGAALGHAAPAAKAAVDAQAKHTGSNVAEGMADVMEMRAKGIGHGMGYGMAGGATERVKDVPAQAARTFANRAEGQAQGAKKFFKDEADKAGKSLRTFGKEQLNELRHPLDTLRRKFPSKTANAHEGGWQPGDIVVMGRNIHEPENTAVDRAWNKYAPKILGPSTHTGIVSLDGKHVIDATPKDGVRKIPFHEAVHGREYTIRRPKVDVVQRHAAAHFAEQRAAEKAKYSFKDWAIGTAGTALPTKLTGVLDAATEQPRKRNAYTCASLVAEAYDKKVNHLGAAATPADFHFTNHAETIHSGHGRIPTPLGGRLKATAHGKAPEITEATRAIGHAIGKHGPKALAFGAVGAGGALTHHLLKQHKQKQLTAAGT